MTAEQTAELLTTNVRVGFNLTMAREDLKCAITADSTPMPSVYEAVNGYIAAFNDAFFGPEPLKYINRPEKAAEVVYGQLGCLVASQTLSIEDISKQIYSKTIELELAEATEHTIRDLISPLVVRS